MPELSPAAQEVFWAFNKAASGKPYDWHYLPAIAAALRAAAAKLRDAYANEEYVDPADDWLDAIAAELEAHD